MPARRANAFLASAALVLALAGPLAAPLLAAEPAAAPRTLSPNLPLEMLYAPGASLIGTTPEGYAWSADGQLAFLWNDKGGSFRDIWLYSPKTSKKRQLTDLAKGKAGGGVSQAIWLPGNRLAFTIGGKLNIVDADGRVRAVEAGMQAIKNLAVSPDGTQIAFVSGGPLDSRAHEFAGGGALWVRSSDGGDTHPARRLVAAEEKMYVESFEWSKQSDAIAFVLADDRRVRVIDINYDAGGIHHDDKVTRNFPGDETTTLKLGIVATAGGDARWFDRPNDLDPIWGFGLSADGTSLFVSSSDYIIKRHRIDTYAVASGRRTEYYGFTDLKQIRPDWQVAWAPNDQGLIILTDRGGSNQLWHQAKAGGKPKLLTKTEGEIASFQVDRAHRQIYFVSNAAHYAERQVYRVSAAGGAVARVSTGAGTHEPVFSPDFGLMADHFSNDTTPVELYVTPLATGATAQVTHSPLPAFAKQAWAQVRYVQFKSHVDGTPLRARVMLPAGYDPAKRYPMILGSVYSDAVRNQWGGRNAHPTWGFDQHLAANGYIVFNVGIRGSFGQGKKHSQGMFYSYGETDINDLESGVRYAVAEGLADPKRVGIWGSSYGGLMTLMSLFKKPGLYAAGIAGAPATNVAHAYPGQMWIMGEPKGSDFPARYEAQSALYQSKGLADPLMIIHGTRDEVVLYSDTIALTERMIAQGKSFELVTLPGAVHGWDTEGRDQTLFAFRKMVDFFDRNLKR